MLEILSDENFFFDDFEIFVLIFIGEIGVCCLNIVLIYIIFLVFFDIDF